jgi:hypothetical protein
MPIADLDDVLLLCQQVGDVDPLSGDPVPVLTAGTNGIIMINADRIWNKYAIYRSIQPALLGSEIFNHYFKIQGAQLVTAVLAERVTFAAVGTAVRVNLSDRWSHHKAMMDIWSAELDKLFKRASAYAIPALAPILAVEPLPPPVPGQLPTPLWQVGQANVFTVDASSYTYLNGSPYWSTWRRW